MAAISIQSSGKIERSTMGDDERQNFVFKNSARWQGSLLLFLLDAVQRKAVPGAPRRRKARAGLFRERQSTRERRDREFGGAIL